MLFLTVVFILSGAAGLIYESIWSRYLGLFVGHSAYAQIIVLVIFLGGMSAGAYAVGERSERVRRPLRMYAYVELAAGVIGVAFDDIYRGVTGVAYDWIFPALAGGPGVTIAKWVLAGLLILPQSVLLGATFPLMSAGALRLRGDRPGRTLGLLYFANSLGAAAGVLLAGFALIQRFGLPGTLITAAAINVVVGLAVMLVEPLLAEEGGERTEERGKLRSSLSPPSSLLPPLWRLLLLVSFGTAVASFIYEIAWIRMLSLVLGSATHSFELMLSAFILGLALGAYWVRTRADRFSDPVRALGVVQWVMGMAAVATLPLYVASFGWMASIQQAFQTNEGGYTAYLLLRYTICLAVMLPATFCAGMTLPLITRTLLAAGVGERAIGAVYAINTLGSIVGVALAGLVLMPLLGLKMLLIAGALVDIALGVMLLRPALRRVPSERVPLVVGAAVASVALVVGISAFLRFEPAVLSSGVFRYARVSRPDQYIISYYRDGRTATVTVRQPRGNDLISLATNGKPDASVEASWLKPIRPGVPPVALTRDLSAQVLLPLTTLAHAPTARVGAVIGQGSGITSHLLLGSPHLRELATIEIEPEMINASRVFMPVNRRVFEDPRSTFVIDDAKSYFAAGRRTYDLILSEPSNPWVSGVSGLFTVEFYQRVRRYLSENGVFGQWLHLYEMDDELVLSVLAALDEVFGDYEVFATGASDILVVASRGRLRGPDWSVVSFPGIREDLRRVIPLTPQALERTRLASRAVIHPLVTIDAEANSDFRPILDLGAERARFMSRSAAGFGSLSERRFDLVATLTGRRYGFGTEQQAAMPDIGRVASIAFGARLRALQEKPARADSGQPVERDLAAAAYRRDVLERLAASGRPPSDWRVWFDQFADAEADLHRGTAGVADERLYGPMLRYARTRGAPREAVAAVEFLHGLASWNYAEVLAASPTLEAAQRARRPWISAELLRDGSVAAHLGSGDIPGARRRMSELTPLGDQDEPAYRFRSRLLFSYILFAERERKEARE
ncbi:MAG: fused MFS/spermidine synthase [Gemmatimonadaceae bacterium]